MKKSKKTKSLIELLVPLLLLIVCVLFLPNYFSNRFFPGTWMNGYYVAGKTLEETNQILVDDYCEKEILIQLDGQAVSYYFEKSEIDFMEALISVRQKAKSRSFWKILSAREPVFLSIKPTINSNLSCLEGLQKEESALTFVYTEDGFALNEPDPLIFDVSRAKAVVIEELANEHFVIDLSYADCFERREESLEEKKFRARYEGLKELFDTGIIYDMGDQMISLDGKIMSDWLVLDTEGVPQLQLKEGAVEAFVKELAKQYDTYETKRMFKTSSGKEVSVYGVTYGTKIDVETEILFLKEALQNKRRGIHIPAYLHEAKVRGINDIGDTYIEISIPEQTLYYYLEGELVVNTPVVTGNVARGTITPSMVCFVYGKSKNATLRGPGYASFVKYWVPVKGGIGIHDSSWRDEYGEDYYLTSGSHGCINTPLPAMEQIYENIEIGTPVIIWNE